MVVLSIVGPLKSAVLRDLLDLEEFLAIQQPQWGQTLAQLTQGYL